MTWNIALLKNGPFVVHGAIWSGRFHCCRIIHRWSADPSPSWIVVHLSQHEAKSYPFLEKSLVDRYVDLNISINIKLLHSSALLIHPGVALLSIRITFVHLLLDHAKWFVFVFCFCGRKISPVWLIGRSFIIWSGGGGNAMRCGEDKVPRNTFPPTPSSLVHIRRPENEKYGLINDRQRKEVVFLFAQNLVLWIPGISSIIMRIRS